MSEDVRPTPEMNEATFAVTPKADCKIVPDSLAMPLQPGDRVYTACPLSYYEEAETPVGTPLTFTRHLYDKRPNGYGANAWVRQYSFFTFPDGSERAISHGYITKALIMTDHEKKTLKRVRDFLSAVADDDDTVKTEGSGVNFYAKGQVPLRMIIHRLPGGPKESFTQPQESAPESPAAPAQAESPRVTDVSRDRVMELVDRTNRVTGYGSRFTNTPTINEARAKVAAWLSSPDDAEQRGVTEPFYDCVQNLLDVVVKEWSGYIEFDSPLSRAMAAVSPFNHPLKVAGDWKPFTTGPLDRWVDVVSAYNAKLNDKYYKIRLFYRDSERMVEAVGWRGDNDPPVRVDIPPDVLQRVANLIGYAVYCQSDASRLSVSPQQLPR